MVTSRPKSKLLKLSTIKVDRWPYHDGSTYKYNYIFVIVIVISISILACFYSLDYVTTFNRISRLDSKQVKLSRIACLDSKRLILYTVRPFHGGTIYKYNCIFVFVIVISLSILACFYSLESVTTFIRISRFDLQ